MIIYNVTINIDDDVHDQWLSWMRDKHIPDMLATGKFSHAKMVKVLIDEEQGGTSYSIQYTCPDMATLQHYYKEDAPKLREEGLKLFTNKFVAFRTELEVISQQIPWPLEHLFTYGTLQDKEVQRTLFKRELEGKPDVLVGYKIVADAIYGRYPLAHHTDDDRDKVQGMVYELSNTELEKADRYETAAYRRQKVVLQSGLEAWFYVKNSD